MADKRLVWDTVGTRKFHTGISHVALYVAPGSGETAETNSDSQRLSAEKQRDAHLSLVMMVLSLLSRIEEALVWLISTISVPILREIMMTRFFIWFMVVMQLLQRETTAQSMRTQSRIQ